MIHVSPTTTKNGFIQDSNGEIAGGMNSKNGLQDTSKDDGEHEDDANPQRDGSRNIHLKKMDFTLPICSSVAKLFLDARKKLCWNLSGFFIFLSPPPSLHIQTHGRTRHLKTPNNVTLCNVAFSLDNEMVANHCRWDFQ